MTNEWGPPLNGEEMKALKGRIDPATPVSLLDYWSEREVYSFWGYDTDGYKLPANHPYYKVREYNQRHGTNLVLHDGSAKVPEDWDGGAYLCRDGKMCLMRGYGWKWGQGSYVAEADWDRIAYTPKPKESEVEIEADVIDPSKVYRFDKIAPERKAELREQGSSSGSGVFPCEQFPSDEAIEVALKDMKYGGVPLEKVKAEPNEHYEVLVVARLIQQYEPDRLKPAVEVAAETYAADGRQVGSVRYNCSIEGFKAGAAWQKENGNG